MASRWWVKCFPEVFFQEIVISWLRKQVFHHVGIQVRKIAMIFAVIRICLSTQFTATIHIAIQRGHASVCFFGVERAFSSDLLTLRSIVTKNFQTEFNFLVLIVCFLKMELLSFDCFLLMMRARTKDLTRFPIRFRGVSTPFLCFEITVCLWHQSWRQKLDIEMV